MPHFLCVTFKTHIECTNEKNINMHQAEFLHVTGSTALSVRELIMQKLNCFADQ